MNEIEKKADKLLFDLNMLCCKWQNNKITYEDCRKAQQKSILQFAREVAQKQRNRDRAVYSINRTKTSIEIRDAILKAPLVTDNPTDHERTERQNG